MSPRVAVRLSCVVCLVFGLAGLSARAEEAPAADEPADLKVLVQKVKKAMEEDQALAAATAGVPFPFGRYVVAAAAPQKVPDKVVRTPTPSAEPEPVELPSMTISGKMKMGRHWKLFIDRGSYGVGDTVKGAKIVEIGADTVTFEYGGSRFQKPLP